MRKKIFSTADWHCYSDSILKLANRPFDNMEHQIRVLINNYNAIVPPNGVCYFLGDMGDNKGGQLKAVMDKLNGTKILIKGNHDRNPSSSYMAGFDVVLQSASLMIAKELITLSHYPLLGVFREDVSGMKNAVLTDNWYGESRHISYAIHDNGQKHLHGHTHLDGSETKVKTLKQWDIGVDGNNFRPVSINQVESWIVFSNEELKYSITYKDETVFINKKILKSQNVEHNLDLIKSLHLNRMKIENELVQISDSLIRVELLNKWTQNEFKVQEAWGFPRDARFHRQHNIKGCICPKMDNDDTHGTGVFYRNETCPIHGK